MYFIVLQITAFYKAKEKLTSEYMTKTQLTTHNNYIVLYYLSTVHLTVLRLTTMQLAAVHLNVLHLIDMHVPAKNLTTIHLNTVLV